jgi:hypothetical protein
MGIAGVATGNARDREGEAQRQVGGIAVGSEANTATGEALEGTEWGVVSGFPSFPDTQRGLPFINVTRPFHPVFSAFFVATVSAIAADDSV